MKPYWRLFTSFCTSSSVHETLFSVVKRRDDALYCCITVQHHRIMNSSPSNHLTCLLPGVTHLYRYQDSFRLSQLFWEVFSNFEKAFLTFMYSLDLPWYWRHAAVDEILHKLFRNIHQTWWRYSLKCYKLKSDYRSSSVIQLLPSHGWLALWVM